MTEKHQSFIDDSLLLAHRAGEYHAFKGSEAAAQLVERLKNWAAKDFQKETAAESSFIRPFENAWHRCAQGGSGGIPGELPAI